MSPPEPDDGLGADGPKDGSGKKAGGLREKVGRLQERVARQAEKARRLQEALALERIKIEDLRRKLGAGHWVAGDDLTETAGWLDLPETVARPSAPYLGGRRRPRVLFLNSVGGSMGRLSKALLTSEDVEADCFVASIYPRRHLVFPHETNVYGIFSHSEWREFMLWALGHYDIVQTTSLPFWPAVAECYDWLTQRLGRRHIWRETGFVHHYLVREDVLPLAQYRTDTRENRSPGPERYVIHSLPIEDDHICVDPYVMFYSSPEKGAYFRGKDVHWLPSIREPDLFKPVPRPRRPGDPVRVFVGHHRGALWKGMKDIAAAMQGLVAEGLPIEVVTPENVPAFVPGLSLFESGIRDRTGALFGYDIPHRQMPLVLASVDLVVDQIVMGSYGNLGIEAMLAGRPVIGQKRYQELADAPIWEADVDTLADQVRSLVLQPELWARLGQAGRDYAMRVHSPEAVARRAAVTYREVLDDER